MTAVLELRHVSAAYGPFRALFDVSLTVEPGEAVALLGANGAGKSTVLKSISGLLAAERGRVSRGEARLDGQDLLALLPPSRVRRGIAHVLEGRRVFFEAVPPRSLAGGDLLCAQADYERIQAAFMRASATGDAAAFYTALAEVVA